MSGMTSFLELRHVVKRFPGVVALQDINWTINRNEVHVLLGENGAGKSSIVKLLAGIYSPDEGQILFEGKPYQPHTPTDAFRTGIRVVHQELNLLSNLSVAENLLFENLPQKNGLVQRKQLYARAEALLAEVGLDISPRLRVDQLGIAQMQLLEIAKALAIESKLLILDEPTATLTLRETDRLFEIIKKLKAKGVTFIYISHHLNEIYEIGDRFTVLRNGQLISTRPVAGVTLDEVVKLMVGRDLREKNSTHNRTDSAQEIFRVEGLKRSANAPEISFAFNVGEIVGIAGLVGSGRTETVRAIFGADPKLAGEIYIDGKRVTIKSPRDAVRCGLCLLTEDRKKQGLMLELPITVNVTISDPAQIYRYGIRDGKAETDAAKSLVNELRIKTPSVFQRAGNLSGGNQQKVVLGKWLFRGSRVLIFDEPTRGIDVGAKQEIYELLNRVADQGKGILIVSSDLSELMSVCTRILVFSKGKLVGDVPREAFDQQHILSLAYQEYIKQ